MKRKIQFILTLILGLFLFVFLMKEVGWDKIIKAFLLLFSFNGFIVIALTFISGFLNCLRWDFILKKLTNRPRFKNIFKIWVSGYSISYLTPIALFGGEPVRAYFAKEKYGLEWKKSAASVIIDRIFDWTLFLIFTAGGFLIFLSNGVIASNKVIITSILLIGILSIFLIFFYSKILRNKSILEWFLKFFKKNKLSSNNVFFETEQEIINFLSIKSKRFWQGIFITLFRYLIMVLRAVFLAIFLEKSLTLVQGLGIYGLSNFALFFPIPATLGTLEVSGVVAFSGLGFTMASGAIFAMVIRGGDLILALIGIYFLVKITASITGEKILKFINNLRKNGKSRAG